MAENAQQGKSKKGFFARIGRFFKDLKGETKKIVWPTRKQVINNTLVVFAACLLIGVLIWGLDAILALIFSTILRSA